jgi:hypothetical protein
MVTEATPSFSSTPAQTTAIAKAIAGSLGLDLKAVKGMRLILEVGQDPKLEIDTFIRYDPDGLTEVKTTMSRYRLVEEQKVTA